MRHGFGVLKFPDLRKYEGEWKFDKQHGKGTFYMSNGDKNAGEWKEGKKIS